ncbi:hypothetical protein ACFC14_18700 [Microbacterium sp. NPDC055988]|uniref:hypothetical protein n=1 Tax=Microbacterium sp. NPDC055988 TaxID=3345671 RepID=UPI0035DFF456
MRTLSILAATTATAALAALLSGCAAQTALEQRLAEPQQQRDTLPREITDQIPIESGSARYIGDDSHSNRYFVGVNDDDKPCLVIFDPNEDWGSACGDPGEFHTEFYTDSGGVEAQLIDDFMIPFTNTGPTEDINGIVRIVTIT